MTGRRPPSAAVLLLHGGRETGLGPPPPGLLNLPAVRMRPFARAVARAAGDGGGTGGDGDVDGGGAGDVLVRSARYAHQGWNGAREDPFHDAVRALDALRREAGDLPVVLVGHSMGARAALRAAGHPLVRGVVGLAPWCPADDPVAQLADRDVVLLHSTRDRVTSPGESRSFATRARRAGARSCLVAIRNSDHAMLRRAGAWHALTTRIVTGLLGLGPLPEEIATALRLPPAAPATHGTLDLDRLALDGSALDRFAPGRPFVLGRSVRDRWALGRSALVRLPHVWSARSGGRGPASGPDPDSCPAVGPASAGGSGVSLGNR